MLIRAYVICALIAASAVPANADNWPVFRHDNQRSGRTPEDLASSALREVWTYRSLTPPVPAWPAPARWDAYAYIRGLRAMRDYDRAFHTISVGDLTWFASSADDSVHCLDARTGEQRWQFWTDGPIRMAPTYADGRLYFGSDDGHAYCVDAERGELIWRSPTLSDADLIVNNGRLISPLPCRTGVVVHDNIAYFGCSLLPWKESWLCAVNASTGKHSGDGLYLRRTGGQTLEGGLLVDQEHLVALRGRVPPFLFHRSSGEDVAALPDGGGGVFATLTDGGTLYHGPGNKTGWVTRSSLESQERLESFSDQNGVVVTDQLHIFFSDHSVTAVSRSTGHSEWQIYLRNVKDVIVAGDDVYVGCRDEVTALSLADGVARWRAPIDGDACGLSVASGRLFVSSDSGSIHCFAESPTGASSSRSNTAAATQSPDVSGELTRSDDPGPPSAETLDAVPSGRIGSWRFHAGMSSRARRRGLPDPERRVQDETGSHDAIITGDVHLREVGGAEAIVLDGSSNSVMIANDHNDAQLPAESLTAEAWVRVDSPTRWGGILGVIQDNGSFERGWCLGYQNSQFSFAVSTTEGPDRLTYLTGKTEFEPRRWYHVAGTYDGKTQRLYVNGKLEAESSEQSGQIRYPDQAWFEIGAYHDEDEYYRLEGMLHSVSLYDRAISDSDVKSLYAAKADLFPIPITLKSGPIAAFTGSREATIEWSTASPSATFLQLTESGGRRVFSDPTLRTHHTVRLTDLEPQRMAEYQISTSVDGHRDVTQAFELDTRFNYAPPPLSRVTSPQSSAESAAQSVTAARAVLDTYGGDRGICLIHGITDAALALEIARQSRMTVLCVDTDRERVAGARRFLTQQGAYGTRVSVRHVESLDDLPFVGRIANLVVSEQQLFGAKTSESKSSPDITEIYRMLRPCGGTVIFRWSEADAEQLRWKDWPESLTPLSTVRHSAIGELLTVTRPAASGSGEWSHLYGKADNSAFGGESLSGASTTGELRVQWIGRPGPRAQPDRSGRKPSPLSRNGRLYVQGLHRLIGMDSYNGTPLWSLEIPSLERFNMPRDCGNWCADDSSVFVAVRDQCLQVDGQTGEITARHTVLPAVDRASNFDWGYVARVGSSLLGSAVKQGTAYTNYWGNADAGWYDARSGPATHQVCSDNLFSVATDDGKVRWSYSNGVILNSTITATEDSIWFLECRHPKVIRSSSRRVGIPELWQKPVLVCLDTRTGELKWQREVDMDDGILMVSLAASDGRLVLCTSASGQYQVRGLSAADGAPIWSQSFGWPGEKGDHGKAMSRPAIVGDTVYVRPHVLKLATGELQSITMPGGGCGTYAATTNALFFRSGNITAWNTDSGSTTSWNRLRPGCWLSTIPANGMLLSPEAGGGCSCGSWLETSIGFMPTQTDTEALPQLTR